MDENEEISIPRKDEEAASASAADTQRADAEVIQPPINQLLGNLLLAKAGLEITEEQYLYLGGIHAWERSADDSLNLVQLSFDEESLQGIVRYVDTYTNRDLSNLESRVSSLLKWGIEQRLMILAGSPSSSAAPQYRLTQLAQDLLKPYFTSDNSAQQEGLSLRYQHIGIQFAELNAIQIEDPQLWFSEVRAHLPSLKDLLEAVSKCQEQLIVNISDEKQEVIKSVGPSITADMDNLLQFVTGVTKQIKDLKTLIWGGSGKVLEQLNRLQQKAQQRAAPVELQNRLREIEAFLMQISEFADSALFDLGAVLDKAAHQISLRLTLGPNANLSQIIEKTIQQLGEQNWGIALPYQAPFLVMREWTPPPPPKLETLPVLEAENEEVVRQNPTYLLQVLAQEIVAKALKEKSRIELPALLRSVLRLQNTGLNETDKQRLAVLIVKTLTAQVAMPNQQFHPNWTSINDDNTLFVENLWVQGQGSQGEQDDR